MLGHASIQQTQRYLNVTDEELRGGLEVSWNNKADHFDSHQEPEDDRREQAHLQEAQRRGQTFSKPSGRGLAGVRVVLRRVAARDVGEHAAVKPARDDSRRVPD
jgi:hypothetical protein